MVALPNPIGASPHAVMDRVWDQARG